MFILFGLGCSLLSAALGAGVTMTPGQAGESLLIEPRTIVSTSFVVTNGEATKLVASWEVDFPIRWSSLGAISGRVELPAHGAQPIPILLSVPANAVPGKGRIILVLRDPISGNEIARSSKPYQVLTAGRLVFVSRHEQGVATRGVPYRIRRWLTNTGNVTARVSLLATSSRGWPIELAPASLVLGPGTGQWVYALVKPPSIWEAEVTNTVTVTANTEDLPDGHRRATVGINTQVLSGSGGRVWGLRGPIELEGVIPDGRAGGFGVNLSLEGDIGPNQHMRLQLGDLLFVGDRAGLTRRGTYVDLDDKRWGGVSVGRTTRVFSLLTASHQTGPWAEVRLRSRLGTLTAFSSISDPKSLLGRIAGVSLESRLGDNRSIGLLVFRGEHAPNSPGQSFSMAAVRTSGRNGAVRWGGEFAVARLQGSESLEPAWRLYAHVRSGRFDWRTEAQHAAVDFPGTVWNFGQAWGRLSFRVKPDLRIWVDAQRLESPDLDGDNGARSLNGHVGISWSGLPYASVSVAHGRSLLGTVDTVQSTSPEREWNLRVDQGLPFGFSASTDFRIERRDIDGQRETGVKSGYTLRHHAHAALSLQARFEPAPQGPQPFDSQPRWSFQGRWQQNRKTYFEVSGEALRCGRLADSVCRNEPSLRLSAGRELAGALSGWRMTSYVQRRGGRSDIAAGVQFARNIAIRSPFGRRGTRVTGKLLQTNGKPGPAGVRLHLAGATVTTNARGEFEFGSVPPGDYLLDVEPGDLGLSMRLNRPLPLRVQVGKSKAQPLDLRLVAPGQLTGLVTIEGGPHQKGSIPFEGMHIYLQHREWPELQAVAVSDSNGTFTSSALLPGRWRLRVAGADVPAGREVSWKGDEAWVEVPAGETVTLERLVIRWHRRPAAMVESPLMILQLQE